MSTMSLHPSFSHRFLFLRPKYPTKLHGNLITETRASTNEIKSLPFFISFVGSQPPIYLSQWNLGAKHINLLSVAACAVVISTSWLFFSAIPTLLAFKRAAESLEKLFDDTAEELPDTMAGVRLSGTEISDLTMELSDISREITQGVRNSTRVVRLAEDKLRWLVTMAPTVEAQAPPRDDTVGGTALARAARNLREGILKGRSVLGLIFSITQFSRWTKKFISARRQNPSL